MTSETTAADRIRAYYDALRSGEPLSPFFARDDDIVKYGITEKLTGYDEIEAGLRAQTRTTADWTVESDALSVTERDDHAWFSDDVQMAWRDVESGREYDFESRWSGTLERRAREGDADGVGDEADSTWRFVGMHVSAVPSGPLAE
ncbi:nuclear transport factor 2 family protein [Halobellus rubicundus]|uniref:Nuclear transport factor 2 family protein n=1 Tax=Halobellus rubicundus TaxID=2996466 RepID=A0ABD5MFN4_9EURY